MNEYLLWYIIITSFITVVAWVCNGPNWLFYPRPSWFWDNTGMDWVGCYTCAILTQVCMPVWAFLSFWYWLFHLGMED